MKNSFFKKHWLLILLLTIIPIISVAVFCKIFYEKLNDVSAWASMIAGIFTYSGTIILSLFVYYHTWLQIKQQEKFEKPNIDVNLDVDSSDKYFVPFIRDEIDKNIFNNILFLGKNNIGNVKNKFNYLKFSIMNTNNAPNSYFRFNIEGFYFYDQNNNPQIIDFYSVISNADLDLPVDYKQNVICFVGCYNKILSRTYYTNSKLIKFLIVIKIIDIRDDVTYLLLEYNLSDYFAVNKELLTESEYKKKKLVKRKLIKAKILKEGK